MGESQKGGLLLFSCDGGLKKLCFAINGIFPNLMGSGKTRTHSDHSFFH